MRIPFYKKLLIIIALALALISILIFYIYHIDSTNKKSSQTITQISELAKSDKVDANLKKVENHNLSSAERYVALKNVVFDFKAGYFSIHNPALRKYVSEDLNKFAKENFPKEYSAKDFIVSCSDSTCGQDINSELRNVLTIVQRANEIPDYAKDTVVKNLQTVGYSPESDKAQNIFGIELAIDQLERLDIQRASEAASLLRSYLKKRYNSDHVKFEYEPPK